MSKIRFSITGKAVAKERARTSTRVRLEGDKITKITKTKTPPRTRAWEEFVSLIARQAAVRHGIRSPLTGAITLGCVFYLPPTKAVLNSHRDDVETETLPHTGDPDLSNLIKSIEDACEGVLWVDDCQIDSYGPVDDKKTSKIYSNRPRVEVEVSYGECSF
jgi:Holliday junction resolvase RusA-like endonuclease